jgi:hypothetical protein
MQPINDVLHDGNFHCFLRFRRKHGDNTLKKYLEN